MRESGTGYGSSEAPMTDREVVIRNVTSGSVTGVTDRARTTKGGHEQEPRIPLRLSRRDCWTTRGSLAVPIRITCSTHGMRRPSSQDGTTGSAGANRMMAGVPPTGTMRTSWWSSWLVRLFRSIRTAGR